MSTRNICAVLALSLLALAPVRVLAAAAAQDQAIPEAAPAPSENEAESFFAELPPQESAFSRLEKAARTIALGRTGSLLNSQGSLAVVIKGISVDEGLWDDRTIPVCFLRPEPGSGVGNAEFATLAGRIRSVASEWNALADTPDFDFGPGPDVSTCTPGRFSVAVALVSGPSNSRVGSSSRGLAQKGRASLNLQLSVLRNPDQGLFRNLVLHEFGHALGMLHEIQHADGQCWERFDAPKLYEFYRSEYGVSNEAVVRSILYTFDRATMASSMISTAQLDDKSVMMYSFPKRVYIPPAGAPCWAPVNDRISPRDVETLQHAYSRRGSGLMELAGLASALPPQERRVVDAFIALMASDGAVQDELVEAIDVTPLEASRDVLADAVFDTAHSREVQSLMAGAE